MINKLLKKVICSLHVRIEPTKDKKCLEHCSMEERRAMWPPAKTLQQKHIHNCKLVINREKMLECLPQGGVCAEIGVLRGEFSEKILSITKPKKLHLIDFQKKVIDLANEKFKAELASGIIETSLGDSSTVLSNFPDNYFDWIYIDGDHNYEGVKKDLEVTRLKIKPDGLIAMNDYIYFAPSDFVKYGVVEAVNEFCLKYDYEIIYFALQERMYNDVVLKKLRSS